MKKRIEWIDIAKYLCIMFVMLSHFNICPNYLREFINPFFSATFFFCSGYCYKRGLKFSDFLKRKIKQLFVPWFIYSNLNIIISNIKSIKVHENNFLTEVFRNMLQIRYYDERLWFIPALFTAFIPFFFLINYYQDDKQKTKKVLVLVIILCAIRQLYKTFMNPSLLPWNLTSLPWHIDYIPTALLFMTFGYLFKIEYECYFDKENTLVNRIIVTLLYLFIVYLPSFISLPIDNFIFDFFYDHIRHIIGILFIVSWCKIFKTNKYVSFVGANTLLYFCLHNKVVTLVEMISSKLLYQLINNNVIISTIYVIFATVLVSIILIIPIVIINKYLPWTIGRERK